MADIATATFSDASGNLVVVDAETGPILEVRPEVLRAVALAAGIPPTSPGTQVTQKVQGGTATPTAAGAA